MRKYISPDASPEKLAEIERGIAHEPQNGNWRLSVEVASVDEDILDRSETVEAKQRLAVEDSYFNMTSPI